MKAILPNSKSTMAWLLVIPVLAWCYIGLFLTMFVWYPTGLSSSQWQAHIFHFTIIYLMWLVVFFSYRLFDWDALRVTRTFFGRIIGALVLCLVIAALYFYFQPALLITPRRFLLIHLLISGIGIIVWYILMRRAASRTRQRDVYVHSSHPDLEEVRALIHTHQLLGLNFVGPISIQENMGRFSLGSLVILPSRSELGLEDAKAIFALRNLGVRFIEFHDLYENLTRTIHLSALSDLWFIHSIDYGAHRLFDALKRIIDIAFGLVGTVMFVATFPIIALLIKLTSRGSVIFSQPRVGQNGQIFTLYKYRTMSAGGANNTWTAPGDARITSLGRFLRALRLDEFPQSLNILRGDMSIVGPRPEQVNIVRELETQIPYYGERHIVKPGLTGWAQLHVYAGSLEETKQKLQYDLYYIKHRSLLFDLEIILKTFYNVITFSGR